MIDEEVRNRVSTLEAVLGEFIVQINKSLKRTEEDTSAFKEEMSDFKREMSEFKDEMRQDRKDMNKKWGELANRLGTVAEDIAAPNIKTMATRLFGCDEIDSFAPRVMRRSQKDRKRLTEFDVIVTCNDYLFVNETKSNPTEEHIQNYVRKLQDVFDFFPEHQGKTVVPIFYSLRLSEPIVQQLTDQKIYALALGGETMEVLNYEEVRGL